jgi:hypothetical protein
MVKNRGNVDQIVTQLFLLVTTFTLSFPGCLVEAAMANSGKL